DAARRPTPRTSLPALLGPYPIAVVRYWGRPRPRGGPTEGGRRRMAPSRAVGGWPRPARPSARPPAARWPGAHLARGDPVAWRRGPGGPRPRGRDDPAGARRPDPFPGVAVSGARSESMLKYKKWLAGACLAMAGAPAVAAVPADLGVR